VLYLVFERRLDAFQVFHRRPAAHLLQQFKDTTEATGMAENIVPIQKYSQFLNGHESGHPHPIKAIMQTLICS
jgi:hypothetical protein